MHPLKVKATLEFYNTELGKLDVVAEQMSPAQYDALFPGRLALVRHARWMCQEALGWVWVKEVTQGNHVQCTPESSSSFLKANRWLGHVQGLLVWAGHYTMNDLREHSRTGGGKYPGKVPTDAPATAHPEPAFPVLYQPGPPKGVVDPPRSVPWGMLAPHEDRAKGNHCGQSLDRLAERGGLGVDEMLWILDDLPLKGMRYETETAAVEELKRRVAIYKAIHTPAGPTYESELLGRDKADPS